MALDVALAGGAPFKILLELTPRYTHPSNFYLGPPRAGLNNDLLKQFAILKATANLDL